MFEISLKSPQYRDKTSDKTMDATHFAFDTNAIVRIGDMRVKVSYTMSLHKTEP